MFCSSCNLSCSFLVVTLNKTVYIPLNVFISMVDCIKCLTEDKNDYNIDDTEALMHYKNQSIMVTIYSFNILPDLTNKFI